MFDKRYLEYCALEKQKLNQNEDTIEKPHPGKQVKDRIAWRFMNIRGVAWGTTTSKWDVSKQVENLKSASQSGLGLFFITSVCTWHKVIVHWQIGLAQ